MKKASAAAAFGLFWACLGAPSSAQELPADWRPPLVLRPGPDFPESYIAQLFQPFRSASGPDQILRQDDVDRSRQIAVARQRASRISAFLSADLDNDGRLTLAEYSDAQEQFRYPILSDVSAALAKRFAELDLDGDGTATFDEAKAAANRPLQSEDPRDPTDKLQQLLALDPNHDGAVTAAELEQLGRAAFAFYDSNKDGILNREERTVVSTENSRDAELQNRRQEVARCMFPRAAGQEDVFFINTFGTGALSSASLVGQDQVTETAEIIVEPGETPLYIVALAQSPTIWRVTGDSKRVTRFVAMSSTKAAGVTGLAKDVVTVLPGTDCISTRLTDRPSAAQVTATAFEDAIGRPVLGMLDGPRFSMRLPSDATVPEKMPGRRTVVATPQIPAGLDDDPYQMMRRRRPGGLVEIDAASVVASADVVPYDMPPLEAGLMKLLQDGTIEWRGRQFYTIKKPIARLPAGLGRGNYVFDVAPGIEPPSNIFNRPKLPVQPAPKP
ncbi:hypothetical protein RLEG12_15470 [Rhizobium leguminosarum bv. trifolii CB782]|nr:hypothetical protein RLEG12_15470 [Rhizobium leguminosarum bv. trifolii CB782]